MFVRFRTTSHPDTLTRPGLHAYVRLTGRLRRDLQSEAVSEKAPAPRSSPTDASRGFCRTKTVMDYLEFAGASATFGSGCGLSDRVCR